MDGKRQWQPTRVLLPGKSHGRRSLVGCSSWGRKESDTTERLHFHFHFHQGQPQGSGLWWGGNNERYRDIQSPCSDIIGWQRARRCPTTWLCASVAHWDTSLLWSRAITAAREGARQACIRWRKANWDCWHTTSDVVLVFVFTSILYFFPFVATMPS